MRLYLWHHLRHYIGVGLAGVRVPLTFGFKDAVTRFAFSSNLSALLMGSLLLLSSAASAGPAPKILVIGDSLSAAYGLNMEQGWVSLLERRLQSQFEGAIVVNASISGDTTRGGAYRLPPLLEDHKPTLIMIELGGNDGLRALPIKQMRENLTAMTNASLDTGAQVLLLAAEAPPNLGRRYTDLFSGIYDQLAENKNVETLPFIVESIFLTPGLMQSDGIHPNAEAQPMLVDVVWTTLVKMLEEKSL